MVGSTWTDESRAAHEQVAFDAYMTLLFAIISPVEVKYSSITQLKLSTSIGPYTYGQAHWLLSIMTAESDPEQREIVQVSNCGSI